MLDIYICFEYNMNMMNIVNKIRLTYISFALVSLLIGAVIYIFLRQGTYIHLIFSEEILNEICRLRNSISNLPIINFLKYYFIDFLWCLALCFSLLAVTDFRNRFCVLVSVMVSALFGLLYELAQLLSIVSGTFDFIDVTMYIVASLCVAMINIKIIKRMN